MSAAQRPYDSIETEDDLYAVFGNDDGRELAGAPARPEILIRPELNAMTEEAIAALAARPDLGVYVRGRMLVTPVRDGSLHEGWLRRPLGAPVIVPIEQAAVLRLMDESAQWMKRDAKKKCNVPAMPPTVIATQILALHEWPFPILEGVIETPTIRQDGTILDTEGYDSDTGLLYDPARGALLLKVPDHPTAGHVAKCVKTLLEPTQDFPFVADSDRSAFIAAVLTLIGRHLIDGPVPMFPVRAPTPGTGKGLLARVIGIIGTGREPAVMTMADGDELRKRITAIAVAGTPLILLDDVSGSLGSEVLAAALTAIEWQDRLLGQTEMVRLPLRAVWLATGNNLGFQRTLGRRVVPIDLDAKVEHPEDRAGFSHDDLIGFVRAERPRIVAAALTLLRGFLLTGGPRHGKPRLGSFERWDDLIRSAVMWAGLDDPAAADDPTRGRGRIRAQSDDDIADLAAFYSELRRTMGSTKWTAAALWQQKEADAALRGALELVATPRRGNGKGATLRSLRVLLRGCVDRPIRGLALVRVAGPNVREQEWRIIETTRVGEQDEQDNTGSFPPRAELLETIISGGAENMVHHGAHGASAGVAGDEGWKLSLSEPEP